VPPAAIEDQDFSPILRAREEAATPHEVATRERAMLASLDDLRERSHEGGPT
jgi:hypothetical protein